MPLTNLPSTSGAASNNGTVDLELFVSLTLVDGRESLQYVLHSASGVANFSFKKIQGPAFTGSLMDFRASLNDRLEDFLLGSGAHGEVLLQEEVVSELHDFGRWLYCQLFPNELRKAYGEIRETVETFQITSDQLWIPWELVKPFDDSNPASILEDDFLCMRFQLTRWLPGSTAPVKEIPISKVAAIGSGKTQSCPRFAAAEIGAVCSLASGRSGVEVVDKSTCSFKDLKVLLSSGGLDILHFTGHAAAGSQLEDLRIHLADRPFRPRNLADPFVRSQIKERRTLVFLNSCQSAQEKSALTSLGGWAGVWINECGCGAFVAPQWSIRDSRASYFSEVFYAALEEGKAFGEAGRYAREKLREAAPADPTWLAYRIYAHPNGRLFFRGDR